MLRGRIDVFFKMKKGPSSVQSEREPIQGPYCRLCMQGLILKMKTCFFKPIENNRNRVSLFYVVKSNKKYQ